MDNKAAYDKVFMECFSIEKEKLNDDLTYESIPEWDSVGHMAMVAGLEDCFEIVLEMDDIIDFSSYNAGIDIMAKYNIVI
ncbi:acyl carrier protein [Alphaproteobacteria bacterium]|nr:acyl carrier protein [Alphaproteobacteria bacterium]